MGWFWMRLNFEAWVRIFVSFLTSRDWSPVISSILFDWCGSHGTGHETFSLALYHVDLVEMGFCCSSSCCDPILCCWSEPACVDALVSSPVCPCKLRHDGQSQLGCTAASVGLMFPGESSVDGYSKVGGVGSSARGCPFKVSLSICYLLDRLKTV